MRVVVRSTRVPIGTTDFSSPVFSAYGSRMGTTQKRITLYGSALNDEHRRAIEEGHKLSCSLGLRLEVVDLSRSGLLKETLSTILGTRGPELVVAPKFSSDEIPNFSEIDSVK